jgi:hypothetical protein
VSDLTNSNGSAAGFEEIESAIAVPPEVEINSGDWCTALMVLKQHLTGADGSVSSLALGRELVSRGIKDPKPILIKLKFNNFDEDWDQRLERPDFSYTHKGRTFFSADALRSLQGATESQAEQAAQLAPVEMVEVEPSRRRNRQEEARLVTYIKGALEDIYDTEFRPADDDVPFAFDVHNERGGSDLENVDLIGFHWRSETVVDTVTVEAKLDFTARLVQQANNYRRFSNRVWIAVPCTSAVHEAAAELREVDSILFDYVVELGMGILACRKAKGRSYEVFPIQWPAPNRIDALATEAFIERYRQVFEDGHVVPKRAPRRFPKVR